MTEDPNPQPPNSDDISVIGWLLGVFLPLCGCVTIPIFVGMLTHPYLGVLTALGSMWVWSRFGPRPAPGCVPGLLCLWGFAGILGALIACLVRAL